MPAVSLGPRAFLEARVVDAVGDADDGDVGTRLEEVGDAIEVEAARKAPVVLEVDDVRRRQRRVVRIDGPHLSEFWQVDAYVGYGKVAHELRRGFRVLRILRNKDSIDVEIALKRGDGVAEQVEAAAARQERREFLRIDLELGRHRARALPVSSRGLSPGSIHRALHRPHSGSRQ